MRWTLTILGILLVALGAIGVLLPGLPAVPFLLAAAACFAKASPRLHRWLMDNPVFGPLLKHWQESRSMPRKAKCIAIIMILGVGAFSVITVPHPVVRVGIALVLLIPLTVVLRLPSSERLPPGRRRPPP